MTCSCGESDCAGDGGGYYVSVRDGRRFGLLAGPYDTHAAALDKVRQARDLACERDHWAWFNRFGTVRMRDDYREPGKFGVL